MLAYTVPTSKCRHQSSTLFSHRGLALLTGLLIISLSGPVLAQSTAVLDVGGTGDVALRSEIGDLLLSAVENSDVLTSVDRRDLGADEAMMLLGCLEADDACMADLAFTLEVDRVLFATVDDEYGTTMVHVVYYDSVESMVLMDEQFVFDTQDDRTDFEMRLAAVVSGRIVLRVVSDREDVEIYVDGALLGIAPVVSLDLSPGRHTLEGMCDYCEPVILPLELVSGRFYTETINPTDVVATVITEPIEDEGTSSNLVPIITTATGGALLVTGMVFGILTNKTQDEFDQTDNINEARDLADQGDTYALLANIFIATGAAVTVTGIILFFTMGGDEEVNPATTAGIQAAPWVGPSSGGVVLDWTF